MSQFLVRALKCSSQRRAASLLLGRALAASSRSYSITSCDVVSGSSRHHTPLFQEQSQRLYTTSLKNLKSSAAVTDEDVDADEVVTEKPEDFLSTSNPHWVNIGVDPIAIKVLNDKGIDTFTPVQGEAIEPVMEGRDVIGRSRTGTGKTLAFGLPSMMRLIDLTIAKGLRNKNNGRMAPGRNVSMVILCPTRELARQVQDELASVAHPLGLETAVFHGGVSYTPQTRALRDGLDILVGTPGRIMDHQKEGSLDLSECNIVVLDEADEMLSMGFSEDVESIVSGVGSANEDKTQFLMFSATTPDWVKKIGKRYTNNPLAIDATGDEGGARVASTVRHTAIQVAPGMGARKSVIEDIISVEIAKAMAEKKKDGVLDNQKVFGKTIVFTETKKAADDLVTGNAFNVLTAQALHGDHSQRQRDMTLDGFRTGAFNVLVATDVAARGIDIKDVDVVIQIDPPRDVDTYVHRSGRTGRAGQKGISILFFSPDQARDITHFERDLGHGFKFELTGPPSPEAALAAAAETSSLVLDTIPESTTAIFKTKANELLSESEDPADVVARCLAAMCKRAGHVESRSLLTGRPGLATLEMTREEPGPPPRVADVMRTVDMLSQMSNDGELEFGSDVGKAQPYPANDSIVFDMPSEDARKLLAFSEQSGSAGDFVFSAVAALEIDRDGFGRRGPRHGRNERGFGGRGGRGGGGRGYGGRGNYGRNSYNDRYDSYDNAGGRDSYRPQNEGWGRSRQRRPLSWEEQDDQFSFGRRGRGNNNRYNSSFDDF